jgi:hypothetical protein
MPEKYCDWSALLGFYAEKDARKMLLGQSLELSKDRENEILRQIATARDYCSAIQGRLGVNPTVEPIPDAHRAYLNDLENTPIVDEFVQMGIKSWSFELVELQNLHVFQPYMNLEYSAKLVERAPPPGDAAATLKYCLPIRLDPANQNVSISFDPVQNTYSIVSENLDLRMLGSSQAEDDLKRKYVGFSYGFGLPQVFVAELSGLFFLKNGYHRAYSLMKRGHRSIPCIVLKAESLAQVGLNRPDLLPADVILSDRSPTLSDYDSRAAVTIPRRRARAVLMIHGGVEVVQL